MTANFITLGRLLLLFAVVAIAYSESDTLQLANVGLIALMFFADALDGHVARQRNEESQFGEIFDIAADRIIELTLWIVFVELGLVPLWIFVIFLTRGIIVDAIRALQMRTGRGTPYSALRLPMGQWLVAGRFMRAAYAIVKAMTFCGLMLKLALPDNNLASAGVAPLVGLSLLLCLLRGLPIVFEFAMSLSSRRAWWYGHP